MPKDARYHRDAIHYNEGLQVRASELADEVEDEEVKRWCRSVAKQHAFHAKRHQKALDRLTQSPPAAVGTPDEPVDETEIIHPGDVEEVPAPDVEKASGDVLEPFKVSETVVTQGEGNVHVVETPKHIHAETDPCGPGCPVFAEEEK